MTGIPGAHKPEKPNETFWFLAPARMAWESAPGIPLTGPKLCRNLLNRELRAESFQVVSYPQALK